MTRFAGLVALALAALPGVAGDVGEAHDPLTLVRGLTDAFNARDVDRMVTYLTDDVQWYSVAGPEISVDADGKEALRAVMAAYFEALPTVRSAIESSMVSGRYVAVRERIYWTQGETGRTQAALAVYEIVDGLIGRVWYYPAEP